MLTVEEAFKKFKSRLEISTNEQQSASRRQRKLREQLDDGLDIAHDFLTGAYARDTKTKPLRDVDIFIELGPDELKYRDQHPSAILSRVRDVLVPHYGGGPRHHRPTLRPSRLRTGPSRRRVRRRDVLRRRAGLREGRCLRDPR